MRLARFWFIVEGKRVEVTSMVGSRPDFTAKAVLFLLRMQHKARPREARLITGRYLPEAA